MGMGYAYSLKYEEERTQRTSAGEKLTAQSNFYVDECNLKFMRRIYNQPYGYQQDRKISTNECASKRSSRSHSYQHFVIRLCNTILT
jgi:hypothetical protein